MLKILTSKKKSVSFPTIIDRIRRGKININNKSEFSN